MREPALAPLSFLIGRWSGHGESHGAPLHATLTVTPVLEGSFLEAREHLRGAPGEGVDHEDICFYRYDAREEQLRVQQLTAPAHSREWLVVPLPEGGIRWYEGPLGVRVELRPLPDGALSEEVFLPLEDRPATQIRYQREA